MRTTTALVALACALLLVPAPAGAKNMHGKFGVGFQRTLLGAQGFSMTYWMTPRLALLLTAGAGFELYDIQVEDAAAEDGTRSRSINATEVLGAMGFKYVLYATKYANLSIGLLGDIGWASKVVYQREVSGTDGLSVFDETENNVTQFGLEAPIEVEFFFSDAFSINLAAGFTFTSVPALPEAPADETYRYPSDAAVLDNTGLGSVSEADHMGIAVGAGGLFGSAGFSFYF